jgi:hypothetical protein
MCYQRHRFYCDIDLHASSMFLCILDCRDRKTVGMAGAKW